MNFNFLSPVTDNVLAHNALLSVQALGRKLRIHSAQNGIPELEGVHIAILGVIENRNDVDYIGESFKLDEIRKSLYALFPGSWSTTVADLGDINTGESVEDTYFALRETIEILIRKNIIPVLLGGSQDLTYANYRAYDALMPMVNLVSIDCMFDLGDSAKPIKNNSYVGKIILDEPYNLFNYSNIGYQTYFNAQEEIDLMERLYFESYRLGEVNKDITIVEPVLRDANIVSLDLKSVKGAEVSLKQKFSPNGLDGTRVKDDDFSDERSYQKFYTLVESHELVFYKSNKTGRWWVEIPFLAEVNNKLKRHTLLPEKLASRKALWYGASSWWCIYNG